MQRGTELQSSISDLSQHSEPGGDDEILYEVIEITKEQFGEYKVHWAGVDPGTMEPWPQSWVAKHDCTDNLALAWKRKEKQRRTGKL